MRNCAAMLSQIKDKLNKPNPVLNMTADDGAINGEQEVLRLKRMRKSLLCSHNKKSSRVPTQQE